MRIRFSIRDLLWLTLVVGMAVAWWIDHKNYRRVAERRDVWKERAMDLRLLIPEFQLSAPYKGLDIRWDQKEEDEADK